MRKYICSNSAKSRIAMALLIQMFDRRGLDSIVHQYLTPILWKARALHPRCGTGQTRWCRKRVPGVSKVNLMNHPSRNNLLAAITSGIIIFSHIRLVIASARVRTRIYPYCSRI